MGVGVERIPRRFAQKRVPLARQVPRAGIVILMVSRDPKGNPLALIVDVSGKVEQRQLTLDRAIGTRWLVASGLQAGDKASSGADSG